VLRNYIKIAFRSLWRNRIFSLINLLGLALGMSACLLIFLYVRFELSYDTFHSKGNRIYRLVCDDHTPPRIRHESHTSAAMGPAIKNAIPEIEDVVRIWQIGGGFEIGNEKFQEDRASFADPSFLTVFDFPLKKGDPKTALVEPGSIVLSETTARRYFGAADPMGKTILMTDNNLYGKVTGVMKDIPENSHIKADLLISMSTALIRLDTGQFKHNLWFYTYVLLRKDADPNQVRRRFPGVPGLGNMPFSLFLEPLKDVYLRSDRESPVKGSYINVYIFSVVAGFILLIACINFVNLTTTKAMERAKEVGIRKVMGSVRRQLAVQFLSEAVFQCLLAFFIAIILAMALRPLFNELVGKPISHSIFERAGYLGWLFLSALGIGILAGFYPALVISAFQPISVLKGRFVSSRKGVFLRQFLVVLQFTIAVVLMASTLIVYAQLRFMRSWELGFNRDQTLIINYHGNGRIGSFRGRLNDIGTVLSTTVSSDIPGLGVDQRYTRIENVSGAMQGAQLHSLYIDFNFFKEYGLKLAAGRKLSPNLSTDSLDAMLVNEATLAIFGYKSPADILGKRFANTGEGTIVGVVKNFPFQSLEQGIEPLTLRIWPGFAYCRYMSVKISTENVNGTVKAMKAVWEKTMGDMPFDYYFLNNGFNKFYQSEEQFGYLFLCFSILAIAISCMGLLGLAAYSGFQRSREIAIRKVLGAGVLRVLYLLSSGFLKLVILGFLIGMPITVYSMLAWLHHFPHHIIIRWWVFALTGSMSVVLALLTISYQVYKAAVSNPVKGLKAE
jgi:putative ABC transport system permease protein